jgi:hypothetical protein
MHAHHIPDGQQCAQELGAAKPAQRLLQLFGGLAVQPDEQICVGLEP